MAVSDRYVDTNEIRLHYLDHSGAGPVLVLAPGLTANAHSFGGLMRAGLGDVARVLALDMRGRGESDAPATGYRMEDHARDVLGLLDALELESVVMGGHSFGGLLTYWLAANHPERVERCVVIDAPAAIDPAIVAQVQPSLDRLGRVYPSWEEYIALVRSMPYFAEGGWDADLERYFRAGALPSGAHRAGDRGRARRRLAGAFSADQPADLASACPGKLRPPGLAAASLPGGRRGNGRDDGRLQGRRRYR
jgi:pimeloyl-ACP methyl ester carboxylesterase